MTRPGEEKRAWHLLPLPMLAPVVDVMQAGARKHSPFGWQTVPGARVQYHDALVRHLERYDAGERADAEDGLPTLAHLVADALILLWHDQRGAPEPELRALDDEAP